MARIDEFYAGGLWIRRLIPEHNDASEHRNEQRATALLLHGWMGNGQDMIKLGMQLVSAGLAVLIPDLPFHGHSMNERVGSIMETVEKMKSVLESLCESTNYLVVCGYSMGGRIALDMAQRWHSLNSNAPIKLVGVICLSSALPPETDTERARMKESEQSRFERIIEIATKERYANWLRNTWYSSPMWGDFITHTSFETIVRRRINEFSKEQGAAWANSLHSLGTSTMDLHPRNCDDIPLLYLYGDCDSKYTAMSYQYRVLFPESLCVSVPGAGHNIVAEAVHNVTFAILEFLLQNVTPRQHLYLSITDLQLVPYSLPLTRPMTVSGNVLLEREGFLLKLRLNSGHTGIGDVAPLPGWHDISVDQVRQKLLHFAKLLPEGKLNPFNFSIETDVAPLLSALPAPCSTAVESAIIQALASSLNYPLPKFLSVLNSPGCERQGTVGRTQEVPANSLVRYSSVLPRLLFTAQDQWFDAMTKLVSTSRSQTLKLKVGTSGDIEHDIIFTVTAARIANVHGKYLRLDANQAWSLRKWDQFCNGIGELWSNIEYIEEPVQCTDDLITLSKRASRFRKIALDESLTQCTTAQLKAILGSGMICALIVKPYMFRSISTVFEFCSESGRLGLDVVFSCAFESGAGLAWVSLLSSWCSNTTLEREVCHGLGTFRYLTTDVMKPSFREHCVLEESATVDTLKCVEFLELLKTNTT